MNAATTFDADAARLSIMLTELRLPTVRRLWEAIGAQSDREGWPAVRLLSVLFEHEIAERESRRLARHRLESNLAADKTLANFDFDQVPTVSKAHVAALAEGDVWIEKGANLLLFGPPGSGKSHLVSAIGHALIDRGWRVLFTRTGDLVQRLQAARRELRLAAELAKLDRFDLLVLDDISYVRRDQAETSVLFELIAERYPRHHGQPAVLGLGGHLPGRGDDAGGRRPAGTPRDDPRDERRELSTQYSLSVSVGEAQQVIHGGARCPSKARAGAAVDNPSPQWPPAPAFRVWSCFQ